MKALMAAKNQLKHIFPSHQFQTAIQHPSFDSRGHHQLLLSMINQSKQKYELAFLFKTSSSVVYSCSHPSMKISQRSHSLASLLLCLFNRNFRQFFCLLHLSKTLHRSLPRFPWSCAKKSAPGSLYRRPRHLCRLQLFPVSWCS